MKNILAKIGVASSSSIILTESLNLDLLWNALITLAISVVSVLAVDGINWLRKYIQNKTKKLKNEEENDK